MIFALIAINFLSVITMYFLNETIAALQRENSKLIGNLQNLNNEILFLKEQLHEKTTNTSDSLITDSLANNYNPNIMVGILGVLTLVICGLTVLVFLKNDTTIIAELSKNSIQTTGDYVKEVIIPSVELLNKASESRITANLDNVKKIVVETGSVVAQHVTDVNKESVLCIVNTIKPTTVPRVLGKISKEVWNFIP